MWRVVCTGHKMVGHPHRMIDKGPLQASEGRAQAVAQWLRATGLYARVHVEHAGDVRSGRPGVGEPPGAADP